MHAASGVLLSELLTSLARVHQALEAPVIMFLGAACFSHDHMGVCYIHENVVPGKCHRSARVSQEAMPHVLYRFQSLPLRPAKVLSRRLGLSGQSTDQKLHS